MAPAIESVVREGHYSGIYSSFETWNGFYILHSKNLSRIFAIQGV